MRHFFYWFFVITSLPSLIPMFRSKVYFEDCSVQGRRIGRHTIVVSNHRSLYDYGAFLLATVPRFSHPLVAEVLYGQNKVLDLILEGFGAIKVDRVNHSTNALSKSIKALNKGQTLYINAEGRLPKEGESGVNEFNWGFVIMALRTGSPVVPVYTNGKTFSMERNRIMIGKPIDVKSLYDDKLGLKENLIRISEIVRQKVVELGELLESRQKK